MEYKSKNAGFLNAENAKDGDTIKILEEAFETFSETKQQTYLNCKVQLSDGTKRLASIDGNFGADSFAEKWGTETKDWIGRFAKISIKESKAGNKYIILIPLDKERDISGTVVLPPEKTENNTDVDSVKYPTEDITPEDIPF